MADKTTYRIAVGRYVMRPHKFGHEPALEFIEAAAIEMPDPALLYALAPELLKLPGVAAVEVRRYIGGRFSPQLPPPFDDPPG